jgi:hydroxymethylpyrimidine kinase/phosphomethylpyrimidine kinase
MSAKKVAKALTIAGSDSGGGEGIQADLKTFAALGVYGSSVVTAVTAQNTQRVSAVHVVPALIVAAQVKAVLSDIGADAIKTGMLANAEIIQAVTKSLQEFPNIPLVVDPVMVAKSGDDLLAKEAVQTLRGVLFRSRRSSHRTCRKPSPCGKTSRESGDFIAAAKMILRWELDVVIKEDIGLRATPNRGSDHCGSVL